jgi:hypothetical protein
MSFLCREPNCDSLTIDVRVTVTAEAEEGIRFHGIALTLESDVGRVQMWSVRAWGPD